MLAVVCNRMQQLHPIVVGPSCTRVGPSREVIASLFPRRPCVKRLRGHNNVGKGCTNGSNIVALRFGDHGTKEMLGVVGSKD